MSVFSIFDWNRRRSVLAAYRVGLTLLCFAAPAVVHAQTLTTVHSFDGTDGEYPFAPVVQASNGNFYGTTYLGGANGDGTVFELTPAGALTMLHSFDGTDGSNPTELVQASDGNFYGTTENGGAHGAGTVFEITVVGVLITLYNFCSETNCTDGEYPYAGLVQARNGNFYGATDAGGANGDGTVFEITSEGVLTTLHSFDGTDGAEPAPALVQANNGNFYGTTLTGGANGDGTVFELTPAGALTTLHSFDGTDGEYPYAGLVQASNGNLYGTTHLGGANGDGTVFELTPAGALTTLHSFDGTDGYGPYALVQASDANFYGTTQLGGAHGDGTVFEITAGGVLTTLHSFDNTDGYAPETGLTQSIGGSFYGVTTAGGQSGDGTVFMLVVPPPKVTNEFTTSTYAVVYAEYNVCRNIGTSTAYCSAVWNDDANGYFQNVNGQAEARANAGSVGVASVIGSTEITPPESGVFVMDDGIAAAEAYTTDTIRVSSPVPVSGVLVFSYTLTGQATTVITGDGTPTVSMFADVNGSVSSAPSGPYSITDVFNIPFTTSFTSSSGTYTDTGFYIYLSEGGGCSSLGPVELGSTCSAVVDYYDTLQITGVKAVDANGNPLPGVTLTSASGYNYNSSPSPTSGKSCNGVYNGTFNGDITVSAGQQCEISGGTVTGNITVTGGNLVLNHATIGGDVHIHHGGTFVLEPSTMIEGNLHIHDLPTSAAENRICGITAKRGVHFHDNGTGVQIGSNTSGCVGNSIGGDLEILNNAAPVQVFDNTIDNDLECADNASITGGGNTAGKKLGQCSKF